MSRNNNAIELGKIISGAKFIRVGTFRVRIPGVPSSDQVLRIDSRVDTNEFSRNKILL